MKLSKRLVQASWWEGVVPAHWWLELGLVPLAGRAVSRGLFSRLLWAQEDFKQPICCWVGLCSCPVGCLARGIPALEPTGCWVGPGLGEKMVTSRRAHASEYFPELLLPVSLSPR